MDISATNAAAAALLAIVSKLLESIFSASPKRNTEKRLLDLEAWKADSQERRAQEDILWRVQRLERVARRSGMELTEDEPQR